MLVDYNGQFNPACLNTIVLFLCLVPDSVEPRLRVTHAAEYRQVFRNAVAWFIMNREKLLFPQFICFKTTFCPCYFLSNMELAFHSTSTCKSTKFWCFT